MRLTLTLHITQSLPPTSLRTGIGLRRICMMAMVTVLAIAMGCDSRPARVPVSGRVIIDGHPLTSGSIRFIPKKARPSMATLDNEGRFTLTCFEDADGAVTGIHQVEVAAGHRISDTVIHWDAPRKYADAATSGLTESITEPTDSIVINLTWDGGMPFDETTATLDEGGPRQRSPAH